MHDFQVARYRLRLHKMRISIVLPAGTSFRFLLSLPFRRLFHSRRCRCSNEVNAFLGNGFSKPRGGLGACPGYIFNFTSRLFFTLLFLPSCDASFLSGPVFRPRACHLACQVSQKLSTVLSPVTLQLFQKFRSQG